jgi:uncharacterized protein (TIGR02246 family)
MAAIRIIKIINMKISIIFLTVCLTTFFSTAQNSQEEELVRQVVLSFQQDFNDGSFQHAADYTTVDWEHLNPMGAISKGRSKVLEEVRAVHQGFLKGVSMTIESMTIRFITKEVSIANVIHKMGIYETPDGVRHENERHLKAYIIVKQNQKWLLAQDQNTIIQ